VYLHQEHVLLTKLRQLLARVNVLSDGRHRGIVSTTRRITNKTQVETAN